MSSNQKFINLTPRSKHNPVLVSTDEYDKLVRLKHSNSWSACQSQLEWLAKLHYLKEGNKKQKIAPATFEQRLSLLVVNWWKKGL